MAQTEPIARSTKVKVEAIFDPGDLSNLLLHIRAHKKTGHVMMHYSNGTLCVVQWNEGLKNGG